MKIFFSVGEPSGDLHGANLIAALRRHRPDVQCVGFGGPRMARAGCQLHADLTQLAVMWLLRVLLNLHKFLWLLLRADRYFRQSPPDAVVLIDYPGFNWWIARRAKAHGIEVFYYGAPQMWAWAGWRVHKMRRLADHVLCKLPFEAQWYRQRGCRAIYVGHPYFDQLQQQPLDAAFVQQQRDRPGPLVTILPGSRTQEVTGNLPWLLRAAQHVHRRVPQARFAVASFNDKQADMARRLAAHCNLPLEVLVHRTGELIQVSHCCMACSGSVSLELLYHTRPSVILYRVGRLHYWLGRLLVRVKYITLVNLLVAEDRFATDQGPYDPQAPGADQIPFPEYPTWIDKSDQLADHITEWLSQPDKHQQRVEQLRRLKAELAHSGASHAAADYLLQALDTPHRRPRPQHRSDGKLTGTPTAG